MYSVKGAADAVGEKADPVEMALEGLEVATAAPEVAITSAKVKNQRTAQFALDQLRQDQQQDVRSRIRLQLYLTTLLTATKKARQHNVMTLQAKHLSNRQLKNTAVEEVYIDGQTFNQLLRS